MTSGNERPATRTVTSAVLLATLIGAFVRGIHVGMADFPLNDGGLFLTMTQDLVANGFAIPPTSSYNGADIPFLYPPLGFYLAGLLSLTGLDLFTIFQFVPLAVSILTIPAVYLLASELLPSRFAALVAAIAFAVVPRSFEWIIAGGGLTRGLGMLFAILTLWAALRLEAQPNRGRCLTLGVLAGLAALSHPGATLVAGTWLLVIVATTRNRRQVFAWFVGAAAISLLAVLPWLSTVVAAHGIAGILGASQTGLNLEASITYLLGFDLANETYVTMVAALGLLGVLLRAQQGEWRWLLWVCVVLIDPRGGTTYVAPIVAAASAIAMVEIVMPAFSRNPAPRTMVWPNASVGKAARTLLGILLVMGIGGSVATRNEPLTPLFALGPETRGAMANVARRTPPDAQIIVYGGTGWWVDATAEWFPVLAERRSLATVQGNEWLGSDAWQTAIERHVTLQGCAFASLDCFDVWRATYAPQAEYVFVPRDVPGFSPVLDECCPAIRGALELAGYPVVFDEPGGTLFAIP